MTHKSHEQYARFDNYRGSLTEQQFQAAAKSLKITDEQAARAMRILVDGQIQEPEQEKGDVIQRDTDYKIIRAVYDVAKG